MALLPFGPITASQRPDHVVVETSRRRFKAVAFHELCHRRRRAEAPPAVKNGASSFFKLTLRIRCLFAPAFHCQRPTLVIAPPATDLQVARRVAFAREPKPSDQS